MTTTPWLTVVIPVYRAEHSISQAISSVTSQGVEGIEIICVDDCSPDNSSDVIVALQRSHPTLHLLKHDVNQGPGPTRNSGIDAATGDYIVFLDADDSLIDGGLRWLKENISGSPDLVLVGCEEIRRGKIRSLTAGALSEALSGTTVTNVLAEPRILFWPPAPWSKVYRRRFLLERNLRLGKGVAQDIPWSAGVTLKAEKVALSNFPFYRYVTAAKDSSITTTKSEKNLVRVAQVRAIRESNDVAGLPPEVRGHLSALAAIHLVWSNRAAYRLLPDNTHESFFHDSVAELRAWFSLQPLPTDLDSSPLMSPADLTLYVRALASDDWELWQKTLARKDRRKTVRRFFRLGRVFGKK